MLRSQNRPAATLMFLLLVAIPLPMSVLAGGLPPSGAEEELSVKELTAEYSGELGFLIEQGVAEPISLATADFDEDGMPDLVVGYGDGNRGLIVLHLGNVEAVYPRPGRDAGEAFQPVAEVFATPHRADFIGGGDFDADGRFDIVVGTLGETTLRLLRGNGTGSFADAEVVALCGELTAMTVGEVNRRDGLADVVVGVVGATGPQLLVFESPLGAFRGTPEVFDAPEGVTTIDLGNHDDDYFRDIVAVTGSYRVKVTGRDRRLSLDRKQRAEVAAAVAIAEPLAESGITAKSATPTTAELVDGEVRACLSMRLNRDAFPDSISIVEGVATPVVVKTLSRAIFTVDSTADDADFSTGDGVCDTDNSVGDGPCTLRAAIQQANASAGADAIEFDITGTGPHSIQPTSALPAITDAVTIDGTTEPDFAGSPIVEIDGTNAGTSISGIYISAANTTVRGLVVNNIDRDAIVIASSAATAVIEGNYIGIDTTGTTAAPITRYGITNWGAADMTIGGTVSEARNIISGVGNVPIYSSTTGTKIQGNYTGTDASGSFAIPNSTSIQALGPEITVGGALPGAGNVITSASIGLGVGGTGAVVFGNLIGTDATGMAPLGNNNWGIGLGATNAQIGGTTPLHRNVISGNGADGISISGPTSTGVLIQGNYIGVGSDGVTPLGNGRHGLVFGNSGGLNTVGGTAPGTSNIIAHNGRDGVLVHTHDVSIPILGNSIHSNLEQGIDLDWQMYTYGDGVTANDPGDLDTGGNNLQNFPVITLISADGSTVDGTLNSLASTQFSLEFFGNAACDPSGHGEGETYLGSGTVTTDGVGDGSFSVVLPGQVPAGSYVTATATDPLDNTSEFSACVHFTVEADLAITKDDGVTTVIAGAQTTYTIVASNPSGPGPAVGAAVDDVFPTDLSCTWTCVAGGGASCTAGPVVGDIDDLADLPVGGTATYTAVCDVAPSASGTISNTATVTPPAGVTDPTPGNNSATDIDTVLELDLGDAPNPTYPTLHASDGARHVLGGALYLGATVDADADGQPTATADGDDTDGTDDEDGVVFTSPLVTGYTAGVDITASAAGLLNAWVDFNADGDWSDAGEQVFTDEPLAAGVNSLGITVPAAAALGDTFARFRIDTTGGLAPTGLAGDGEVEDYLVALRFSFTEVPVTGQTTSYAAGDDGTFQAGIPWPEPRFVNHGDGTITDILTGLMWTQDNVTPGPPACNPGIQKNWYDSFTHVDCLNAEAYLGYADWRVPNALEVTSLVHNGEADQRTWFASQGFTLSPFYYWWSSTTPVGSLSGAFVLSHDAGTTGGYNKNNSSGPTVWPVRGSTTAGIAPVPKTGQVRCWNSSFSEIPCTGTGQDGDHQAGMEWPTPRFEVNGDCVTDRMTGLIWTKDGNPFGFVTWAEAVEQAQGLSLCGFDDWRLATRFEAVTLVHFDRRISNVPPTMMEWWENQGFVNTSWYQSWTGTTQPYDPNSAYTMLGGALKPGTSWIAWPVRGNLHNADADLSVELTDSPDPVAAGGTLIYTVTASNLGPATVDEVTVTTTLDAGAVFVGATGTGWTCGEDTGVVTCDYGALAVASAPSISIEITTPSTPGATLLASALVDSLVGDPVPDNNAAEADTEILGPDFGDAPDPTYPTLLASDGARHSLGGALFLGATVDSEPDGQPTAGADGDDLDGTDDEDGVVFSSALRLGLDASVSVEASTAGLLNAWIDFNADGDWDDPGEQIFTDTALTAGTNALVAAVPIDAALGATFARFRVDSTGGLTPTGAAADGEVEDHAVTIDPSAELGVNIGDSPDPVRQGRRLTYSVAVDNNGGLDATGVVLTDTLDGNVSFVSASLPACSETGGVVTCNLDTLSAGTSAMIFVEVDVNPAFAGVISNTAIVTLTEEDPIPANNTDTETTTVVAPGPHVFSDGFETGDTTRWSSTVGD